ncbi:DedA family protein [Allokutzneria albata]|uniref:Membrane-associated protein n=1 Tax=Allokutzneria albata TaxID=211114 RepID=A0A1G9U6N8_ALLAB|nr:DedA family protein [Allokutzneria albata]SDM55538.1 membrane-associated protein [Allokutzneria albata]
MIHLDLTQLSMVLVHLVVFAVIFVESGVLVGLVLPGDSVLFMSGLLAARSGSSVVLLVVLVFIAAVAGDSVGYRIGRVVGRRAVERRPRLLARAQDLYRRHGWFAVVIARWYPWIRTVMPLLAGMGRMPYPGFLAANALGAVLWGCGTVLLGYFAHSIPGLYQASLVLMGLAILATLGYLVRQRMIAANSDCLRRGSDRNLPAR